MTRKAFTPRRYQTIGMQHLLEHSRCALWAGMGMGKTVTTGTALDALSLVEDDVFPALVCAPLRVARSTWPAEFRKWDHLKHLRVSAIVGDQRERKNAISMKAEIYTTNYEQLPWLVERFGHHWPYRTIVADESTKLKGFRLQQGGQRAQALGRVAHAKARRFIELTGTPAPNGLIDLWGQAWFLDAGARLGRSFEAYKQRWFQSVPGGDGYTQVKPLPFAQEQIQDKLRDLCLTLDPRDWFDLKKPIRNTIRVELPMRARQHYRDMEREMFAEIEGAGIEAFNAASRTIKCLQLANGAIYTDEQRSVFAEVHDAKLQALEDVIEEAAGTPVLVAYQFKHDLQRLLKAFPKGRALDTNPQTEADWNAGKIPVLFAHPASAGHGLNLQDGGNIIAFFGHWWDLELRDQIIERIGPVRQAQAGYDRPVWIYDIVADDTIDDLVIERHETKREVQDILLDAMKRRTK